VQLEQRFRVSPLALPEPESGEEPEALAGVAAVALFCDRARATDPEYCDTSKIIRVPSSARRGTFLEKRNEPFPRIGALHGATVSRAARRRYGS
jgi:hypothetical protein